ncbi:MAG: hypothetical protein JWM28_6, partial [Chitinophagaceae bacterium]|nr:hypothetical protein [Chitinophagaceae bacterium]
MRLKINRMRISQVNVKIFYATTFNFFMALVIS